MSSTTETSQPQVGNGNGDGASAPAMVQVLGVNLRVCWDKFCRYWA